MAAVVAQQHTAGLWHRRPEHPFHVPDLHYTGMMTSYNDQRTAMDAPSLRSYQPPTSQMDLSLPLFSANALATSVPYQTSGTFAYESSVNPYNMQQNGLPQSYGLNYSSSMQSTVSYAGRPEPQSLPTVHNTRHAFSMASNHMVEAESASPVQSSPIHSEGNYPTTCKRSSSEPAESANINFATDVDTLMKAIQAKQTTSPTRKEVTKVEEPKAAQKPRKRYQCHMPDCHKSFYQKTHLEIHIRVHTGAKPFKCKAPGCGQRFSQLGNLKAHERRHTGERPYSCDICGKTFAHRGNVRAHKIVHQQIKPFTCRLDDCGKQFTQLGSLKSHQNKFHASTLKHLTQKFGTISAGGYVSKADKELWEYFASLYKNSNKGIKGRGKDRRTSTLSSSASVNASSYTAMPKSLHGYHENGSDRSSFSSSMSTDHSKYRPEPSYDFNAPIQTDYSNQGTGYDNMVFPERKMF